MTFVRKGGQISGTLSNWDEFGEKLWTDKSQLSSTEGRK